MAFRARQWVYSKPLENDCVTTENFALQEIDLPELMDGDALVRVKLVNIHANTRLHLAVSQTQLGQTDPTNYACAEVLDSRTPAFKNGDIIACQAGWQEHQVINTNADASSYGTASELVKDLNRTNSPWTYAFRPALVKMWPPDVLMEMFGTSGLTAYFGVRECGPLTPRDRVAVAGVTGSVGSIVAQLAKAAGSYVAGFAGGPDRCTWAVETLGLDACLDYRAPDFEEQLRRVFPEGIDVYSDGIGGPLTELVTKQIKQDGRIFSYGAAAAFYAGRFVPSERPFSMRKFFGISDAVEAELKRKNIKTEFWMVDAFYHERLRAEDDLSRLLIAKKINPINSVVQGFENLPQAITELYQTHRNGKLQVSFE
jgi:NADPH-dependent curcumin reductase CurA